MPPRDKTLADLDRIDRRILEVLQEDGRISNVKLAKQVNLTPTPCLALGLRPSSSSQRWDN